MKKLLSILTFFTASVFAEENRFDAINERNAFTLLSDEPTKILPPITDIINPPIKLYLTGIMRYRGLTNVYLYSKDIQKRFITLNHRRRADEGITLLSVNRGLVKINNNGITETLSFESHKLPSTLMQPPKGKPTVVKKNKDSKQVKSSAIAPTASIVKVPSRRPKIDPRIIQKSLEYIDKVEDKEKKEYILNRLEGLQSGQQQINVKIDENELRRRYDNSRKDKAKQ